MKYRHFRDENGSPRATLASSLQDDNSVQVALARCKADEDTFEKAIGRHIASKRVEKKREFINFENLDKMEEAVSHLLKGYPIGVPKQDMGKLINKLKGVLGTRLETELACR